VLLVLYVDGIGADGDVGKNGTFNSAPVWLLLPAPFKAKLVLQHDFLSQNVLLQHVTMCWIILPWPIWKTNPLPHPL
jgi:hypothetical protein